MKSIKVKDLKVGNIFAENFKNICNRKSYEVVSISEKIVSAVGSNFQGEKEFLKTPNKYVLLLRNK